MPERVFGVLIESIALKLPLVGFAKTMSHYVAYLYSSFV